MDRKTTLLYYLRDISPFISIVIKYDYSFNRIFTKIRDKVEIGPSHAVTFEDKIVIDHGKNIKIFDIERNFIRIRIHKDIILYLGLLSNNNIVSASQDQSVRIWNPKTEEEVFSITFGSMPRSFIILPNDIIVIGFHNGDIRLLERYNTSRLRGHIDSVSCFGIININTIVSGSFDGDLRIWDIENEECTHILKGHYSFVMKLIVIKNKIISGDENGDIIIWNSQTGELESILKGHDHKISLLYAVDDNIIISSDASGKTFLWDLKTKTVKHVIKLNDVSEITSIITLPYGNLVIGTNTPILYLYNPQNGKIIDELNTQNEYTIKLLLLSDNRFVNVTYDGEIIIWE